ncbi:heme-degrading domain-containing protein [Spirosoma sp. HMF3257]|uniref:UPF0303 protein HMF3257_09950 n=1 Tax=Spirosoma telluris TaxID=2183553 RepID=A0A327NJG5_9BACT|nr:heme-degrading domain-containing protein [Spirosoma telluris]RAI74509.1 heme-degrading domain-containing protein [Spirosoma telluris]
MESQPNLAADLARIALQEERLQFDHFTAETAWELGSRLREAVKARRGAAAIDIQLAGQPLFFLAMPGTTPDNGEWIRRKRNTTLHFHRSSYAVGLRLQQNQTTLSDRYGLSNQNYASHGGSFPLWLKGTGCMGAITVSGLPQREDHSLIVAVLANWLKLPIDELALDER